MSHYTNKRIRQFASLHWERAAIRSTIAGLDTIVFHTERAAPDAVDIEFERALRIVLTRLESRFKELTRELLELGLEQFNDDELRQRLGITEFPAGRSGLELLKAKRLFPTATINGMSGGWVKEGHNTIIPATAFAKLDFRLAPDMHPDKQFERLKQHLSARGFGDIEVIRVDDGSIPWYTHPSEAICQSLIRAAEKVYGETPTVVTPTAEHEFFHLTGVRCALTGFGGKQPNLHGPNENISVEDYITGIKYAAQIFHEFSK